MLCLIMFNKKGHFKILNIKINLTLHVKRFYLQPKDQYRKPLPSILGINLKFNWNSIWNSSHRNHVKN
ncbi:hypothetical protein BpHYR1_014151 [Brachionus plicatilis]|uniref:Uncharacterized protein n=1 Tax=Brachionus plicatilis TaxID=10195 RepID=A0A3M7Q7V2_BRAPC|nr:hypothetical protein BpHYR1_014151 [Brachionus plicatilis]